MNWVSFGIACIELLSAIVERFKQAEWYQKGVADANSKADGEQQKRIDLANAARADADHIAAGGLPNPPDPNDRDAVH